MAQRIGSIRLVVVCVCIAAVSTMVVGKQGRKLSALVEEEPLVLTYHNGLLLTHSPLLNLHLIWYGKFTPAQRSIVADFVQSLGMGNGNASPSPTPSVSTWWKTTEAYKGTAAPSHSNLNPVLGKQVVDEAYSMGKSLKRSHIAALVENAIKSRAVPSPLPPQKKKKNVAVDMYLVLTSEDVMVENFCQSSCGFHASTTTSSVGVPYAYAWVGNSESQCPGQCAWPFHQPLYGPQTPPLVPPNGDVGIDGMIINMATVIAGTVTNPFNTGYFQGNAAAPLEAVSACPGIYGKGAYPGFPGQLLVDQTTGASYNAHGLTGRTFLLPAMWDPLSKSCKTLV